MKRIIIVEALVEDAKNVRIVYKKDGFSRHSSDSSRGYTNCWNRETCKKCLKDTFDRDLDNSSSRFAKDENRRNIEESASIGVRDKCRNSACRACKKNSF